MVAMTAILLPEPDIFLAFNAGREAVNFPLPAAKGNAIWRLAADTSLPVPEDLYEDGHEPTSQDQSHFRLGRRSSAILLRRT